MKPRTRLLFVHDERSSGDTMKQTLEQMGYDARLESDPGKVFAEFGTNSRKFDAIIVNQFMPKVSGLELARWLSYTSPRVPVILLCGYPDSIYMPEEEPSNVRAVLYKPLSRTELSAALDRAFSASGDLLETGDRLTSLPY